MLLVVWRNYKTAVIVDNHEDVVVDGHGVENQRTKTRRRNHAPGGHVNRGGICHCRHCRRQCKIFASGVNFSLFTHFLCFFPTRVALLKLGVIDGVKFLT